MMNKRYFPETQEIKDPRPGIGTPRIGRDFDPIAAAESSLCHGRIGLVAWALFEHGDGLVLSLDKMGKPFTVEAHSKPEKDGFLAMVGDLMARAEKLR